MDGNGEIKLSVNVENLGGDIFVAWPTLDVRCGDTVARTRDEKWTVIRSANSLWAVEYGRPPSGRGMILNYGSVSVDIE